MQLNVTNITDDGMVSGAQGFDAFSVAHSIAAGFLGSPIVKGGGNRSQQIAWLKKEDCAQRLL